MRHVDTIIVGNGISAKLVNYYLNKIGLNEIVVISAEAFAPACSTRTTAINSLRGTRSGLSNLGDLIIKSYSDFKNFFDLENPMGVAKTKEWQCWSLPSPHHDKWIKRFGTHETSTNFPFLRKGLVNELNYYASEAFVFSPELFYQWLDSKTVFEHVNDYVIDVSLIQNQKIVKTKTGRSFSAN